MKSCAVEGDLEISTGQSLSDRVLFFPGRGGRIGGVSSPIPEHDASSAVLTLWDRALECVVVDRVIFDLHCQTLHRRIEAGALGHGPALHHSIELEPQIEMEITGRMLLDDEPKLSLACRRLSRVA